MKTFKKQILLLLTISFLLPLKTFAAEKVETLRVAALSQSVAEMWLLSGGSLVGATDDSLSLPMLKDSSGENKVQSIGSLTLPSLEALLSLDVNLVLMTLDIPSHKKIRESLLALKKDVYVVDVKSFSDYEKVMKDFTTLTGREDLFKKNVLDVKERISKIISSAPKKNESYIFLRVSAAKNKVLKNHFANEIFSNLGLYPALNDTSPLDEVGMESLLSLDPDYIFVVAQGDEKRGKEIFTQSYVNAPGWKKLSAVKKKKVFFLPKDLFNFKPNDRWDKAYEYVLSLL